MKMKKISTLGRLSILFLALGFLCFPVTELLQPEPLMEKILVREVRQEHDLFGRYLYIVGTDAETQRGHYSFPYRGGSDPQPGDLIEADVGGGPMFHGPLDMLATFLCIPSICLGLFLGVVAIIRLRRRPKRAEMEMK